MTTLFWLAPTLGALFAYGIGQGLVKKWISEVPAQRYCLYLLIAKALVNLGFYVSQGHPPIDLAEGRSFFLLGTLAYIFEGAGWILYFESVKVGPITIVGTLSAAYPGLTVLFARFFLNEALAPSQYAGVGLLIVGCLGLSYSPDDGGPAKTVHKRWVPLGLGALLLWGAAQTLVKYAYGFPRADEANLAVFATLGAALTLGVYGMRAVFAPRPAGRLDWGRSLFPMMLMGAGDLAVLVATKTGPVSVVTPLSGAYPIVTMVFAWQVLHERISWLQWLCFAAILGGVFLSPGTT